MIENLLLADEPRKGGDVRVRITVAPAAEVS